uniref:Uncharacterized protein n=1 Tax=Panagrolaimus davidi TaxID=227884 RepID=A0A914QLR6_9BILA
MNDRQLNAERKNQGNAEQQQRTQALRAQLSETEKAAMNESQRQRTEVQRAQQSEAERATGNETERLRLKAQRAQTSAQNAFCIFGVFVFMDTIVCSHYDKVYAGGPKARLCSS